MEIKLCLFPLCTLLLFSVPVQPQQCRRALDVVLLLDVGPDINDDDWNQMTLLSRDVSHHLRPFTFGTHVALALFGGNVISLFRVLAAPLCGMAAVRSLRWTPAETSRVLWTPLDVWF